MLFASLLGLVLALMVYGFLRAVVWDGLLSTRKIFSSVVPPPPPKRPEQGELLGLGSGGRPSLAK